ncbi:MAG: hypothetical protein QXO15_01030 [Nitrososphaerota archaeon]
MTHKRSFKAEQRRAAKKYIRLMAYEDRVKCESVNRLSVSEVITYIAKEFGGRVHLGAIPRVEVGEVIIDSRGGGSFQRGLNHEGGNKTHPHG